MFTKKEMKCIDKGAFTVLASDDWNVTVQSLETGDRWHILNTEWPQEKASVIYRQDRDRGMVLVGGARSLDHAIAKIMVLEAAVF